MSKQVNCLLPDDLYDAIEKKAKTKSEEMGKTISAAEIVRESLSREFSVSVPNRLYEVQGMIPATIWFADISCDTYITTADSLFVLDENQLIKKFECILSMSVPQHLVHQINPSLISVTLPPDLLRAAPTSSGASLASGVPSAANREMHLTRCSLIEDVSFNSNRFDRPESTRGKLIYTRSYETVWIGNVSLAASKCVVAHEGLGSNGNVPIFIKLSSSLDSVVRKFASKSMNLNLSDR